MVKAYIAPTMDAALERFKGLVTELQASPRETGEEDAARAANPERRRKMMVFCEDKLSLQAERAVCSAVGGSFDVSVQTFSRFLRTNGRIPQDMVLSEQGGVMVMRKVMERERPSLVCFRDVSARDAAQSLYDTVSLIYSSGADIGALSPESLSDGRHELLRAKMEDIGRLYAAYYDYLRENRLYDRNTSLSTGLADCLQAFVTRRTDVVLLGYQAFTGTTLRAVRECVRRAANVYGVFTGGDEPIYVNEALSGLLSACRAEGMEAETEYLPSMCVPEAEALRRGLYDPETFRAPGVRAESVSLFESDGLEGELEFAAAETKKYVAEGGRYRDVSLMLPDAAGEEPRVARVFSEYGIPYYMDGSVALSGHFLCGFLGAYFDCVSGGCLMSDVLEVVSNPLFDVERASKDVFKNYLMRLADGKGGVFREPDPDGCLTLGFEYVYVTEARNRFLEGLNLIPANGFGYEFEDGVKALLAYFGVEKALEGMAAENEDSAPSVAAFCRRVFGDVMSVASEAARINRYDRLSAGEFYEILRCGLDACKVSIIPPKQDAVFVGDVSRTLNVGTEILFACGMSDAAPAVSDDTSLLTDRDLSVLEGLSVRVTPKIRDMNMRTRETACLNMCSWRKNLFLSYTAQVNGDRCPASEIVEYARRLFCPPGEEGMRMFTRERLSRSRNALPYLASEKVPALRRMAALSGSEEAALYALMEKRGYSSDADEVLRARSGAGAARERIRDAVRLYTRNGTLSPTGMENWFRCPFYGFMKQGLKVQERDEGSLGPRDTGNFIHTVLQGISLALNGAESEEEARSLALARADELMKAPPYSSLTQDGGGSFTAEKLRAEAADIAAGVWEQIRDSSLKVARVEAMSEIPVGGGVRMFGFIDRVDEYADPATGETFVRVIDYKTGGFSSSAKEYYMGTRLQLPLYLLSASEGEGKRPVGAYYFPASTKWSAEGKSFRLDGYTDVSEEAVTAMDNTARPGEKSRYFDAGYGRRTNPDGAMSPGDMADFLRYGKMVVRGGAAEMMGGYIQPSPVGGACDWCPFGGCCRYSPDEGGGERDAGKVSCARVAGIARMTTEGGGEDA